MRFRNSLRLLMENFKHVYKILLSRLIIGLIAAALCAAFVLPEVMRIWNSEAVQGLWKSVKAFGRELASFTFVASEMESLKAEILSGGKQVARLLSSMTLEIVLTIVGCLLVYLVKRFAETVCYFTTGSMLNDKMATYAESPYGATLVAGLGKASVYSLVYVPLVFVYDVVMLAIAWGLLSTLPIFVALFGVTTEIVCLQALKMTLTGHWMPAMTADGYGMRKAMRALDKNERKQRFKSFSTYLVSVYFIVIINVIAAICTFGSALILTVPSSYFFLICMQYVQYYTVKGKKYFLTYEHIATNPDHGDSEHFFEYIGEENTEDSEN